MFACRYETGRFHVEFSHIAARSNAESTGEDRCSNQTEEMKKANEAFENSRDQRIQNAKQGSQKQSHSTKTASSLSNSQQITGNEVFLPILSTRFLGLFQ